MKKLLAVILVFTLVLSMSLVAFAGPPTDPVYEDTEKITIDKKVISQGVNPEEIFSFKVENGSGDRDGNTINAPSFNPDTFTIKVVQGAATGTSSDIILPTFTQVGVYTYEITEQEGNTAGMDYLGGTNLLKITVINDPDGDGFLRVLTLTNEDKEIKIDNFKNKFHSGNLTVKKEIAGNYADSNDEFEVTVTLTPRGDKVIKAEPIVAADADSMTPNADGTITIVYTVKGGNEFTIKNIPYDVDYAVVETDSGEGYEVSYDKNKGGEFKFQNKTTTITNTRDEVINTGLNLDNLPYILILGAATIGLFGFTMKRRFNK